MGNESGRKPDLFEPKGFYILYFLLFLSFFLSSFCLSVVVVVRQRIGVARARVFLEDQTGRATRGEIIRSFVSLGPKLWPPPLSY